MQVSSFNLIGQDVNFYLLFRFYSFIQFYYMMDQVLCLVLVQYLLLSMQWIFSFLSDRFNALIYYVLKIERMGQFSMVNLFEILIKESIILIIRYLIIIAFFCRWVDLFYLFIVVSMVFYYQLEVGLNP